MVLDVQLIFYCGCKLRSPNLALTIAGYASNNRKKLPEATYGIKPAPIERPPVNIETLFARAISAAKSCYVNQDDIIDRLSKGKINIKLENAQAWRQDDHLGRYTVSGLFQKEPQEMNPMNE